MGRNTSIKTSTTDNFTQLVDNMNNQSLDVGATGKLTTTVDSDIVGAINELDSNMGAKTSLTTTNKTSIVCLLYTSPSPRDCLLSRMPSSA